MANQRYVGKKRRKEWPTGSRTKKKKFNSENLVREAHKTEGGPRSSCDRDDVKILVMDEILRRNGDGEEIRNRGKTIYHRCPKFRVQSVFNHPTYKPTATPRPRGVKETKMWTVPLMAELKNLESNG